MPLASVPVLYDDSVDPGTAVGFDMHVGRYLCCGTYGIGIGYMNINPDDEMAIVSGTAGNIRATLPALRECHSRPQWIW